MLRSERRYARRSRLHVSVGSSSATDDMDMSHRGFPRNNPARGPMPNIRTKGATAYKETTTPFFARVSLSVSSESTEFISWANKGTYSEWASLLQWDSNRNNNAQIVLNATIWSKAFKFSAGSGRGYVDASVSLVRKN